VGIGTMVYSAQRGGFIAARCYRGMPYTARFGLAADVKGVGIRRSTETASAA